MKILKPGKVEMGKFTCPDCGCEFIATEVEVNWSGSSSAIRVFCPQAGCRVCFEADWEPYEEPTPTQTDRERLKALIAETPEVDIWPDANTKITDHLIAHGVTFRED